MCLGHCTHNTLKSSLGPDDRLMREHVTLVFVEFRWDVLNVNTVSHKSEIIKFGVKFVTATSKLCFFALVSR